MATNFDIAIYKYLWTKIVIKIVVQLLVHTKDKFSSLELEAHLEQKKININNFQI